MNWGGKSKNAWKLRSFLARKIAVQNTDMLQHFYKGSKKAVLIPRGVDIDYFQLKVNSNDFKDADSFFDMRRYLICVANFVPVKGVEVLISAFNQVQNKYRDWSLLLVGDHNHDYGNELIRLVNDLNLNDRIIFTGKQLDIRPYLQQAEIFILPSKNEGSPVALLEAMAGGIVVLGTNIPGIRDQLSKFPDFLFTSSDSVALSKKLDNLMGKSKEDLKTLGNTFYQHVKREFPIEKEIKNHQSLYWGLKKPKTLL